jgi:molybdate transport system regulatory protein
VSRASKRTGVSKCRGGCDRAAVSSNIGRMAKLPPPTIRLRIDLSPDSALGPGKIALLERIGSSGSLSQAARELGMSYRRAWLLLDDINRMFADPATTASVGGSGGGGAQLTTLGKAIIKAYREIESAAERAAGARIAWLASCRSKKARRTAMGRRSLTLSARKGSVRRSSRTHSPVSRRS